MKTICKPVVNKPLDQMNGLQRAAEAFRYLALSIEFWISPEGQLRNWVKTNARISAFIAAPTFMVFPVAVGGLWELSSMMNALTSIATKLIFLPILVILSIIILRLLRR